MKEKFLALMGSISPVDSSLSGEAQAHLDDLTKPQGSLGRLEEVALRFVLASGSLSPVINGKKSAVLPATMVWLQKGFRLSLPK